MLWANAEDIVYVFYHTIIDTKKTYSVLHLVASFCPNQANPWHILCRMNRVDLQSFWPNIRQHHTNRVSSPKFFVVVSIFFCQVVVFGWFWDYELLKCSWSDYYYYSHRVCCCCCRCLLFAAFRKATKALCLFAQHGFPILFFCCCARVVRRRTGCSRHYEASAVQICLRDLYQSAFAQRNRQEAPLPLTLRRQYAISTTSLCCDRSYSIFWLGSKDKRKSFEFLWMNSYPQYYSSIHVNVPHNSAVASVTSEWCVSSLSLLVFPLWQPQAVSHYY